MLFLSWTIPCFLFVSCPSASYLGRLKPTTIQFYDYETYRLTTAEVLGKSLILLKADRFFNGSNRAKLIAMIGLIKALL